MLESLIAFVSPKRMSPVVMCGLGSWEVIVKTEPQCDDGQRQRGGTQL